MNFLLVITLVFQTIVATSAVLLNLCLLFIIRKFTTKNFGFYKNILMSFAIFEIVFAITVLLGEPIFFISQRTLIAFTYFGPISGTSFAFLGPTTYCFFYLVWLGFVVLHFIYRYVNVCRPQLKEFIKKSTSAKLFIWFILFIYIAYSFYCAYFSCMRNKPHKELLQNIYIHFGVENGTELANYVLRFTDIDGNFSLGSTIAVLTHYVVIIGSVVIVFTCSWKMWQEIRIYKKVGINVPLERQLFKSLVLQTVTPIIFSHFPSFVAMCFPLISIDLDIFSFFSVFTTVPKALDPLILVLCIKCYRRGVKKLLYAGAKVFVTSTSAEERP